jgi:MFS superfamily sulfate permease-like transporter
LSASIPGIVYALLGSSKQLNVAPEAALSLLLGQAISQIKHDYPEPKEGEVDFVGLGIASVITLQVSPINFEM